MARLIFYAIIGYVIYRVIKMFMNFTASKDKGVVSGEKPSKEKKKDEHIVDAEFKDIE